MGKILRVLKSSFLKAMAVLLTIVLLSQACSTAQDDSAFITTPAQEKYADAFMSYMKQVEQEGVTAVKEIRVEESQPFIFILKPESDEITDEEVENVTELALRTVSVFDSTGGLKHDDIEVAFHRPTEQKILLIKRRDMPELLSADTYGELTIAVDQTYFRSLVNLAGPVKNGNPEFTNAWSVVQAICLAYAGDFQDSDPVCNIISANAAAGWVGMEEKNARDLINNYGMTDLGYLGSKDYRYRFIEFVYEAFVH
jgi:hypothetical protein